MSSHRDDDNNKHCHGGDGGNGGNGGRRKRHTPTDAETLRFRQLAHEALDPFWDRAAFSYRARRRRGCYAWLRRHLRLPEPECHISRFSIEQCKQVIELCRQARAGIIDGPREHHGGMSKHMKRVCREHREQCQRRKELQRESQKDSQRELQSGAPESLDPGQ